MPSLLDADDNPNPGPDKSQARGRGTGLIGFGPRTPGSDSPRLPRAPFRRPSAAPGKVRPGCDGPQITPKGLKDDPSRWVQSSLIVRGKVSRTLSRSNEWAYTPQTNLYQLRVLPSRPTLRVNNTRYMVNDTVRLKDNAFCSVDRAKRLLNSLFLSTSQYELSTTRNTDSQVCLLSPSGQTSISTKKLQSPFVLEDPGKILRQRVWGRASPSGWPIKSSPWVLRSTLGPLALRATGERMVDTVF